MKKLLILSGKGGTGKTTTAAAFIDFSKSKVFADCDVDAPNLHLALDINSSPKIKDFYGMKKAKIDSKKCINCGKCKLNCKFDAIDFKEQIYKINSFACEGCGVCEFVCPQNAIKMIDDVSGDLILYDGDFSFSTAKLKMGRGNSGKLVSAVKSQLKDLGKNDIMIIDGSPGIGCPVIASISGVNLVLIVAEPSLSGISDMKRIVDTAKIFGTKVLVCVNKFDTCIENTQKIQTFCKDNSIPFVGKIPFDKHVFTAVNEGKSISKVECSAKETLLKTYNNTVKFLLSD